MKKNYKRLLIFLAIIALIVSLYFIVTTYAKYLSSATGSTSASIARWNIVVNGTSIKNNTTLSSPITPVFPGNDNYAADIIAPGAEGYFDLIFDFSDVDVSFNYTISVSGNENNLVDDFVITGYSIDDGDKQNIDDGAEISEEILHSSNITSRTVRVYVSWDDDANTETMNNSDDTYTTTVENGQGILDVNITFAQIKE